MFNLFSKKSNTTQKTDEQQCNEKKKLIFAFWESVGGAPMPAYLELCMDTWRKNVPGVEICVLNYSNLHEYIGDVYDIEDLKKISLAMQSDIISAAVLERFGGLFIDVDCIITGDIFDIFDHVSKNKLIAFGRPNEKTIHLAVLYCSSKGNKILRNWRIEAQKRLKNLPEKYDWSYFGNAIVNPMLRNLENVDDYFIIDRTLSGNILESSAMLDSKPTNTVEMYKNFYFNKYLSIKESVLDLVKFGIISLHNSWTPKSYRDIQNKSDFLKKELPINSIYNAALKNTRSFNYNLLPFTDSFVSDCLDENQIAFKKKYFNSILVLDFNINQCQFGCDILYKKNKLFLDLVARNQDSLEKFDGIMAGNEKISENKYRIGAYKTKQSLVDNLIELIKKIQNRVAHIENDKKLIKLERFEIKEQRLFIDGIGIIFGKNAAEYSDIDYQIIFKNLKNSYVFRLAKAHRDELTDRFSNDRRISYAKCWFTTSGYAGIDISKIEPGAYKVILLIEHSGDIYSESLKINGDELIRIG